MAMQDRLRKLREELNHAKERCDGLRQQLAEVHSQSSPTILREVAQAAQENFDIDERRVCQGHFGKIYALYWGQSSEFIVTAAQDGRLIVWRAQRGSALQQVPLSSSWVMTCAFSPNYTFTGSGGLDNTVTMYKVSDASEDRNFTVKELHRELEIHEGYVSCARFKNENEVLSSSGDGTCALSDISMAKTKVRWVDHTGDVMGVSINPTNPDCFASGSIDATVRIWDSRTDVDSHAIASFHGHQSDVNSVAWMRDGHCIVSGSDDSTVRLFDDRSYRQLMQYEKKDEDAGVAGITSVDVAYSSKRIFAALDNGHVFVYETLTGKRVASMPHPQRVSSLGIAPSGQALATGCWDFNLRIYA